MSRLAVSMLVLCGIVFGYLLRDITPGAAIADDKIDDGEIVMVAVKESKESVEFVKVHMGDTVFLTNRMKFIHDHRPPTSIYAADGKVIYETGKSRINATKMSFSRNGPLRRSWRFPKLEFDFRE